MDNIIPCKLHSNDGPLCGVQCCECYNGQDGESLDSCHLYQPIEGMGVNSERGLCKCVPTHNELIQEINNHIRDVKSEHEVYGELCKKELMREVMQRGRGHLPPQMVHNIIYGES